MVKRRFSLLMASAVLSATMLASPFAAAGNHGDKHEGHHGKHHKSDMCEQMREGTGKFSPEKREARMEERRAKMEQRHQTIADRLELNEEQRATWDDIHEEHTEKRAQKMEKWQEKMKERCADQ
ncbi:hypothetical protein [Marinobacter sp.]|uniref:hypothetical protein n=1 Tax=Marinobacter sp. TaxID=50741 RepID=UPI0034A376B9